MNMCTEAKYSSGFAADRIITERGTVRYSFYKRMNECEQVVMKLFIASGEFSFFLFFSLQRCPAGFCNVLS